MRQTPCRVSRRLCAERTHLSISSGFRPSDTPRQPSTCVAPAKCGKVLATVYSFFLHQHSNNDTDDERMIDSGNTAEPGRYLLTTLTLHHTFTVSFQAQNTFSTNLFHHSLLAPTWTAFSDYTGPDLLCSTVFHF